MKILCRKSIECSVPGVSTDWKIGAHSWNGLINKLESEAGIDVDSIYRRRYEQFIEGYKDGSTYEIEVTKYSDGTYEVMFDNIVRLTNDDVVPEYRGLTERAQQELESAMGNALNQIFDQNPDADFMFCLDNVIGLVEDNVIRYSDRYSQAAVEAVQSKSRAFRELASQFVEENYESYRYEL